MPGSVTLVCSRYCECLECTPSSIKYYVHSLEKVKSTISDLTTRIEHLEKVINDLLVFSPDYIDPNTGKTTVDTISESFYEKATMK